MLIGTAISKPIAAVNNVPKIAGKAPNTPRTASQDELPIKENPNLLIAGMAFTARTITRLNSIPTITMAKTNVELEKILSAKWVLRLNFQLFAFAGDIVPCLSFFVNLKLLIPVNGKYRPFYRTCISPRELYSGGLFC